VREYNDPFLLKDSFVELEEFVLEYAKDAAKVASNVDLGELELLPAVDQVLIDIHIGVLNRFEVREVVEEDFGRGC